MVSMLIAKQRELFPYGGEEGVGKIALFLFGNRAGIVHEMDFLEIFLELPVINKCVFPFRD